jgi:hypothetical protein
VSELDPPRLSKGSGSPLEQRLAGMVDGARADLGTPEQVMRLEASLLPLIGPPMAGPGLGAPPAGPTASGGGAASVGATAGIKATAIAVAVIAAAGGGLWLHSTRAPAPAPIEQRAPVSVVTPAEPTIPTPSIGPEAPAEPPAMAPAPSHPSPPAGGPGASKETPALSEPELIGQAQAALAGNPGRALSLCEKHRKQFPHGVLVQEREVLAIEALARLGRHAQAVDRGERFLKSFPSSAHRSKIVGIIGPR